MRIAVLLSGGVDSSVALCRLAEEGGHELVAFYLKIWLEDELASLGACPWEDDLHYARAVCEQLDVPLEVVPLQRDYHARVVQHAIAELSRGRTPSPDIHCNTQIKFGAFYDAVGAGFDAIASGHYARVVQTSVGARLFRAPDPIKDQTYFLSRLSADQLGRVRFPIGDLTKDQVRALASRFNLVTQARPDSQGICFLGRIKYPDFVRSYLGDRPGPIVDVATHAVLGQHRGAWYHTVGQRKGLGLHGGPWFVTGKDLATDTVFVAHKSRYAEHRRDRFEVDDIHWIGLAPVRGEPLELKLRHGPTMIAGRLTRCDGATAEVAIATADQGVAPGQSAVFYRGEECLGQGIIR